MLSETVCLAGFDTRIVPAITVTYHRDCLMDASGYTKSGRYDLCMLMAEKVLVHCATLSFYLIDDRSFLFHYYNYKNVCHAYRYHAHNRATSDEDQNQNELELTTL